jgi:CubicO group peptidase (beta-lactamase class C family)
MFNKLKSLLAVAALTVISPTLSAETVPATAADLGLMQGAPVPIDKQVTRANFMSAPYNRWALQHIRELFPSREISRGDGAVAVLKDNKTDLSGLQVKLADGRELTVSQWLSESYTDGFMVMHKGEVVYEQYFNSQTAATPHQMFSASKSFTGVMLLDLAAQGKVDLNTKVSQYLPELSNSAHGDATLQQVLDMTNGIQYSEDYEDPKADVWQYGYVFGIGTAPANYKEPMNIHDYLATLKKSGNHGEKFHYVTPNTDVLGWIVRRVSGQTLSKVLEQSIWSRLGAEQNGYYWLEGSGTEMAGGGMNITLRDAARLGQMILNKGQYNGQQILPKTVAERILRPGDPGPFNRFYQDPWYEQIGFAYHDQWWTFNNSHKAVSAIGVHGQFIYIDPVAEMVLVKQSSHPQAESESNEVDGPQIMQAIAEHLLR